MVQPVGPSVNATSPPSLRAATISGVASTPPRSRDRDRRRGDHGRQRDRRLLLAVAAVDDADHAEVGAGRVLCARLRAAVGEVVGDEHDRRRRRTRRCDRTSPPSASTSTLTWSGKASPAGGPSHSHCAPGKNTPGTGSRLHAGSLPPPGPTPHGRHSLDGRVAVQIVRAVRVRRCTGVGGGTHVS